MELNICKLLQFDQRVGSNLSPTSGHWAAQGSIAGICDRNLTENEWKLGDFPRSGTVATVQQREFLPQQNDRIGYNPASWLLQICQRRMVVLCTNRSARMALE
jgi:hypothetical protein